MDAPLVDQDVLLQGGASAALADLQHSLQPFLWIIGPSGNLQIRSKVRASETTRLVNLLEPFQALPQLLDAHLDKLLPFLADALIASLRTPPSRHATTSTLLLIPLPEAICKLLYTFCKIRGEKVIVRFLGTDIKLLGLLLSAIEARSTNESNDAPVLLEKQASWEERYVILLWLTQLLLAPFDLVTFSSGNDDDEKPTIPGLTWPRNCPEIVLRIIPLAIRYLSSPGKERDAAKALLVRVTMRRDMQELGISHSLVEWALACLGPSELSANPSYFSIGIFSFLAGCLSPSTSSQDMKPYLTRIFNLMEKISQSGDSTFKVVYAVAVARKIIIKILRNLSILTLHGSPSTFFMVEETINILLGALSDAATPVRLAASKALSMITSEFDPSQADLIVDEILSMLKKDLTRSRAAEGSNDQYDLARANAYEWHGLILTLSHLLYRNSIPNSSLSKIVPYLVVGLQFRQRTATGASRGTNVRDAACFGIWSLARRYRTEELVKIKLAEDIMENSGNSGGGRPSLLQDLATELVVSASLDPDGNIRRGSSAALQELVGRHPNMIDEGIPLVQIVDYHAVALRANALDDVAYRAGASSDIYYRGLMNGLLGWRGVRDKAELARVSAGRAIGRLNYHKHQQLSRQTPDWSETLKTVDCIVARISELPTREVDDLHGLLTALTCTLNFLHTTLSKPRTERITMAMEFPRPIPHIISVVGKVLERINTNFPLYRSPELIARGTSILFLAVYPIIRMDCAQRFKDCFRIEALRPTSLSSDGKSDKVSTDEDFIFSWEEENIANFNNESENGSTTPPSVHAANSNIARTIQMNDNLWARHASIGGLAPDKAILDVMESLLRQFMAQNEEKSAIAVADAAAAFILLHESSKRHSLVAEWDTGARESVNLGTEKGNSYIHTIFKIASLMRIEDSLRTSDLSPQYPRIIETIKQRWNHTHNVQRRTTILECYSRCSAKRSMFVEFESILDDAFSDFSTDARGDIGSLVRIAAAGAMAGVLESENELGPGVNSGEYEVKVVENVVRLASEKLDNVRRAGKRVLLALLKPTSAEQLNRLSVSTPEYFDFLLNLNRDDLKVDPGDGSWEQPLLEGYVTAAGTGSEDLIRSSRTALAKFIETHDDCWLAPTLIKVMRNHTKRSNDRVLVPTMELLGFLFDMGLIETSMSKELFDLTAAAHYKSKNFRKLEAALRIYGGLLDVAGSGSDQSARAAKKLLSMLQHPFPKVRALVAEELWFRYGVGKGVDWGTASKADVEGARMEVVKTGGFSGGL